MLSYRRMNIMKFSDALKKMQQGEKEKLPYKEGTDKLIIGNGASIPLELLGKQYTENEREGEE